MVSSKYRGFASHYINFIARPIAKTGLNPSVLTFGGLLLSFFAAYMYAVQNLMFAAFFLIVSSIFDVLDGAVARLTKKVSPWGGFLDSLADRYSDAVILIGLALYFQEHYVLIFIVLSGSLLVSYTRARAEMEIENCNVGFGERAERILILITATILQGTAWTQIDFLYWALVSLAIITHVTVLQRAFHTYNVIKN